MTDRNPVVTAPAIGAALVRLGVDRGAVVVAHSALRSFGWVEGGEDAVIDALTSAVGPEGTVCMPTLTYGDYGPRRPPPRFDPRSTPCIVGRIPERFRQRPGVLRSMHPTHSIAAAGVRAEWIVEGHERAPTPCGPGSPWGRIAAAHGLILMLGVGTRYCTMFHGPEEQAETELRCGPPTSCRIVTATGERSVPLRLHKPYRGALSNRAALHRVLEEHGLLRSTDIGRTTLLSIDARGLWELGLALVESRPSGPRDRVSASTRRLARRGLGSVAVVTQRLAFTRAHGSERAAAGASRSHTSERSHR